jgi:hypothetical protein
MPDFAVGNFISFKFINNCFRYGGIMVSLNNFKKNYTNGGIVNDDIFLIPSQNRERSFFLKEANALTHEKL